MSGTALKERPATATAVVSEDHESQMDLGSHEIASGPVTLTRLTVKADPMTTAIRSALRKGIAPEDGFCTD